MLCKPTPVCNCPEPDFGCYVNRACDAVKADPEMLSLRHFVREKDLTYDDLLPDVLAMYAKGYLCRAGEKSKKLALTAKGRAVLGETTDC